ncbi:MAG: hypothetical protein MZV64_00470 [Ignavibacteriales bacterium]|nr:hypothetical protein [Ignavibacteriales bacterium]
MYCILQMLRDAVFLDLARVGARGVQEGAARAPGPVDDLLGQDLVVVAVIGVFRRG